ncbi:MAG: DUF1367 family protein [Mariprofundaceae bacterium]|nr:DUF1367 family protein [Mariprofundaceae bacterium]
MAEIHLRKMQGGMLVAATQQDHDLLRVWRVGTDLRAKIVKPRNGQFHRLAFALLNLVLENQERYSTIEDLLVEFKLKSGHYSEHVTTKGVMIYVPKSIAFDKMDQSEFEILYSKWIDIALQNFMDGFTEQEIHEHCNSILNFT